MPETIDGTLALEVWTPAIEIPPGLVEATNRLVGKFDRFNPIGTDQSTGVEIVGAPCRCPWHDDKGLASYSALLVIRNDVGSWVEVRSEKPIRDQPVGTLILLDIRKEHRLICPGGTRAKIPKGRLWAAVAVDFILVQSEDRAPYRRGIPCQERPSLDTVERLMREALLSAKPN